MLPASGESGISGTIWGYQDGKNLEGGKIDLGKLGSPPSYQTFLSIFRMLCAKMCAQEIPVTIWNPTGNNISHPRPTRKHQQGTLYQKFSFISKKKYKPPPPPNLDPPPKKPLEQSAPPPYSSRVATHLVLRPRDKGPNPRPFSLGAWSA